MELQGTLKKKGEVAQVTEKFKKLDFVITDGSNSQYPQHIAMQLSQDKCNLLDDINIGDEVLVHFNLRGREWVNKEGEVKFFNTIDVWKVAKISGATQPNQAQSTPQPQPQSQIIDVPPMDPLPF